MSRRATSRAARHQRAATASLAVRSGAPAAAVAAVSSLTLTGVAVLGFMPGGSALAGLPSGSEGLRGPGVVEAIPVPTTPASSSTRPSVPGRSFTVGGSGTQRLIGPSGGSARPSSSRTRSSAPTTSSTTGRTPNPPTPIVVTIGGLSETQASSARQMVVNAVNSSLSAVMKPRQLLSVQATLTPAVDLAVRSAVSSAASDALNAATAATAGNASPDQVSAVTTQVFRSSLAPALAATVPVAVSSTLATAGVVTPKTAPVVDALVTVAASAASSDVADVATPTVVEQVTTVITTPGATATTPVLTPTPTPSTSTEPTDTTTTTTTTTSPTTSSTAPTSTPTDTTTSPSTDTSTDTSTEQPTGTPEQPDADAAPTDEAGALAPAAPTGSSSVDTTGPTTVPAPVSTLVPTTATTPHAVSSVVTSHALVAALATPTPVSPGARPSTSDLYRVSPHLVVRVTTSSPQSARRTTTMIVPTVPASSQTRTDRASAQGQQARGEHVTHAQKAPVSRPSTTRKGSSTSATARTTTTTRSPGATTSSPVRPAPSATVTPTPSGRTSGVLAAVASDVPDGFSRWSTKKQWRWLRASGQKLSYAQWKDAVRQASGMVDAGSTAAAGEQSSWVRRALGRHRR